jgi:hypothetical protein
VLPISTFAQLQIQLIENERTSPLSAYAILEVTTPNILVTSSLSKSNFNFSFDRVTSALSSKLPAMKQDELGIKTLMLVETNKTEIVQEIAFRDVMAETVICPNKTANDCYTTSNLVKEQYSYPVSRSYISKDWVSMDSVVLKPNMKYRVKLESVSLKAGINYDWILMAEGVSYKQWAWWNDTWLYSQNYDLNSTVSTTLINFTTNMTVNHSTLVAKGCLINGSDIRIVNSSGYVHKFEIDNGNNTATMQLWVLVPSFPNGIGAGHKNYSVTLYCGNRSAVVDGQAPTLTWPQYTDVYHFQNTKNSATGQFNLNTTGSPTFQTAYCKYGTCLNTTAGSASGTLLTSSLYYAPTNLYIECWARKQSVVPAYTGLVTATKADGSDSNWALMTWTGTGADNMILYHIITEAATSVVIANTMTHWVGVWNNTSGRIWKDGNSVWLYAPYTRNLTATIFDIGGPGVAPYTYWDGVVDECRFSTNIADKTADWINASRSAFSTAYAINDAPVFVMTVTPLNQTINMTSSGTNSTTINITVNAGNANLTIYAIPGTNVTVGFNSSTLVNFTGSVLVNVSFNTSYYTYGNITNTIYVNSTTAGLLNKSVEVVLNVTHTSICTSGFAYSHIRVGSPSYAGENVALTVFYANEFGIPVSPTSCNLILTDSIGTTLFSGAMAQMGTGLFVKNYTFDDTGDYFLVSNCECETVSGTDASVVHVGSLKDIVKAVAKYEDKYREQYGMAGSGPSTEILSTPWFGISLGLGVLIIIGILLYNAYQKR